MALWKSRKNDDGTTQKFQLRSNSAKSYIVQNKAYWETEGVNSVKSASALISTALERDTVDSKSLQEYLIHLHSVLRKGVNIEALSDLSFADPTFEARMLDELKIGDGETLKNLMIFDGSRITGMVNVLPDNVQNILNTGNLKALMKSGGQAITRLQVIPLGNKIYMSLASRGEFYYREGNVLIPFSRLTQLGFREMVRRLSSEEMIGKEVENIQKFNKLIEEQEETIRAPGGIREGEGPWATIPREGGPKEKEAQFSLPVFLNNQQDKYAEYLDLKNDNLIPLAGRLNQWGVNKNAKEVYSDLVLFSLLHGNSPKDYIGVLNTPTDDLSDTNKEFVAGLKAFMTDQNAQNKAEDMLVNAFIKNFGLSGRLPNNRAEFTEALQQDPSTKALWDMFVDDRRADDTAQIVHRYSSGFPNGQGMVGSLGNPKTGSGELKKITPTSTVNNVAKSVQASNSAWARTYAEMQRAKKSRSGAPPDLKKVGENDGSQNQTTSKPQDDLKKVDSTIPPGQGKRVEESTPKSQTQRDIEDKAEIAKRIRELQSTSINDAQSIRNTAQNLKSKNDLSSWGNEYATSIIATPVSTIDRALIEASNYVRDETGNTLPPATSKIGAYIQAYLSGSKPTNAMAYLGTANSEVADGVVDIFTKYLADDSASKPYL